MLSLLVCYLKGNIFYKGVMEAIHFLFRYVRLYNWDEFYAKIEYQTILIKCFSLSKYFLCKSFIMVSNLYFPYSLKSTTYVWA